MIFLAGSSALSKEELEKKAKEEGILLLNPKKIGAEEELFLAEALAKNAAREKRGIAKKEEMEFLLWLSAKTNISSAYREYWFKSPKNLLLVSLKKGAKAQLIKQFRISEKKPEFKKHAAPAQIERISLSRI
jgi:tRNA threonylcarbamoyladenosine modification (KEOPS) complex Cgi121 subunit